MAEIEDVATWAEEYDVTGAVTLTACVEFAVDDAVVTMPEDIDEAVEEFSVRLPTELVVSGCVVGDVLVAVGDEVGADEVCETVPIFLVVSLKVDDVVFVIIDSVA